MSSFTLILLAVVVAIGGTGCRKNSSERTESTPKEAAVYAAPRWPSYFKPPQSIEELMPAARSLVRNKSGFLGVGMGVLQSGETVLIAPTASSDPMVVEAIVTALKERGVATHVKHTYELLGMTREREDRQQQEQRSGRRIADAGIYQASSWISGQFPDPTVPKAWLKEKRPDIFAELFPGESGGGPAPASADAPLSWANEMKAVGQAIQAYLEKTRRYEVCSGERAAAPGCAAPCTRCRTGSSARSSLTTSGRFRAR